MGNPYVQPALVNYNLNPPPDDDTQSSANAVRWSTIKTKLPDPIKAYAQAIDAAVISAVGKLVGGAGVTAVATTYTVQTSDQGKTVAADGTFTVTTPDATTVGAPFVVAVVNVGSGTITVDGSGSQTIDGAATLTLSEYEAITLTTDGSNWFSMASPASRTFSVTLPFGYGSGCGLSNAADTAHDITIAAGEWRDSADSFDLVLAAAMTKQIDVNWVAGTAAGGFPSGLSIAADTWYHVFLVDDGADGTDAGFDTSLTAANLLTDTGGTYYRRIGSVLTDGTSNVVAFTQDGDEFIWTATPALDLSGTASTTAALATLTVPPDVQVRAKIRAAGNPGQTINMLISSPDVTDQDPDGTTTPLYNLAGYLGGNEITVRTDTSARVRYRSESGTPTIYIATIGWLDRRGK